MKKLMIVAAIVCAAAFAQAASVTWGGWGYTGDDPSVDANWFTGGQAYLVWVTDSTSFAVTCDNGKWDITGGSIVSSADIADGSFGGNWDGAEATLSDGQHSFAVIMTTAGAAGSTLPTDGYWGVSTVTALDDPGFAAATGGTWNMDDSFNEGNGINASTTIGAVPEPTSGLLLLLGVAGLSLRRRRA